MLKELITGAVGAALGATATIATGAFGYLNKDRELDLQMVGVALTILSGERDTQESIPARKFALRALSEYSNIEIPPEEFETWASIGVVPQGSFSLESSYTRAESDSTIRSLLEMQDEVDTLAQTIWLESGEQITSYENIANVITNRVKSPNYPNNIKDVILSRNQFSAWSGSWDTSEGNILDVMKMTAGSNPSYAQALEIASRAVRGELEDRTAGATLYHSTWLRPKWASSVEMTLETRDFIFYKQKGD